MGIKAPKEADVLRVIIDYLELRGALTVRVNGGLLPTPDGRRVRLNRVSAGTCSDVVFCYRGVFGSAEVKGPKGKPTPGQLMFLDAVTRAGGVAAVVRSVRDVEVMLADIEGRT